MNFQENVKQVREEQLGLNETVFSSDRISSGVKNTEANASSIKLSACVVFAGTTTTSPSSICECHTASHTCLYRKSLSVLAQNLILCPWAHRNNASTVHFCNQTYK